MPGKGRAWGRALLPILLLLPACCAGMTATRREAPPSMQAKPLESTLPLILVDSNREISGTDPTSARMQILENPSGRASLGTTPAAFSGDIAIQIRGQSSRRCPKKQYSLALKDSDGSARSVPLLGMPAASEWILQGPCLDRSLIRNPLAYDLSNRIGRYAVRTRFVEAFIREGGREDAASHYAGVYVLMEKIARGPERVDVAAVSDDEPSGGYILRVDRGDQAHFITARGTLIEYVEPRQPTPIQQDYLKRFFEDLEGSLAGQHFADPKSGYALYLDVDSFVDHYLLNELMRNGDALRLSAYMHKDRGGKLAMGPIWDFDRSVGNVRSLKTPEGWFLPRRFKNNQPPFWWSRLLEDPAFRQRAVRRWAELRQDKLSDASLMEAVDSKVAQLEEAARRNFEVWPFLGVTTSPFDIDPVASPTWEGEVQELRTFLAARALWMDGHMDSLGKGVTSGDVKAHGVPAEDAVDRVARSGRGILGTRADGAGHNPQAQQNDACDGDVELGDSGDRQGPGDAGDQNHESHDVNEKCHEKLLFSTAETSRPLAPPA